MLYSSVEEAQAAKMELVERIQSIDVQLTERAAQVVGRVPDAQYKEYMAWKARACGAKARLVSRLTRTRAFIREYQEEIARQRIEQLGPDRLLLALYKVTKSLITAGTVITPDQQDLLDTVSVYLGPLKEYQNGENKHH